MSKKRKKQKKINNKYKKQKYILDKKINIDKKYMVIFFIVLVCVLLILTVGSLREDRNLTFFEKIIKDGGNLVVDVLATPFNYIKEQIEINKEKDDIYKKYKKIKEKAEKSDLYYAQILELQDEIETLKESLALNNVLSDYEPINANISSRDVGYWYNTITIDKGSHDGIKKDMAVVVNSGLIGKVIKVSNFYSTVKLLTTDELSNKISVKIKVDDEDIYALLVGYDKNTNTYTLEGTGEGSQIPVGSLVTTTGLSQIFPSGILVGEVASVTSDQYDLTKIVKVTPSVDFDDIRVVTVLKRGVGKE